jgi:hypothetical protein
MDNKRDKDQMAWNAVRILLVILAVVFLVGICLGSIGGFSAGWLLRQMIGG